MCKWLKDSIDPSRRGLKFWFHILSGDLISLIILILFFFIGITALVAKVIGEPIIIFRIPFRNDLQLEWIILPFIVGIFASFTLGIMSYFSGYEDSLKNIHNYFSINMLWENIIPQFKKIFKDTKKLSVIKSIFNRLAKNFVGVVIGANEKEYLDVLTELIHSVKKNIFATLRGGINKPRYNINWFFEDSYLNEKTKSILLRKSEKQEYLKKVNSLRKKISKIRIIILRIDEMEYFVKDEIRNNYLKLNDNVELYLINPNKLKYEMINGSVNIGSKSITLGKVETSFINEDYAVIDEQIAVKHNGSNTLYLGVESQLEKMLIPFYLLDQKPEVYERLRENGISIYDHEKDDWVLRSSWEDWKDKDYLVGRILRAIAIEESTPTNFPKSLLPSR